MDSRPVYGGRTNYGQLVGILMTDSTIPRVPGDPGHAETFPFPVRYGVLKGFPFEDLIEIRKEKIDILIDASKALEKEGVRFIAADCGLFSPFQRDIADRLSVPFIGSALDLVPFISRFMPASAKIGIITGDSAILKEGHLKAAGADPAMVIISGMENSGEFQRVVIGRELEMNIEAMRTGVVQAAEELKGKSVGAVILECTNLITYRLDVQKCLGVPVFDVVSLIEFFAAGYRLKAFLPAYI